MRSYEVLIIGGGPAGSSCAWRLKRAGVDVVVWDRREFPRDKICAGWITPLVSKELQVDLDEYARSGRTLQPIRGFRVGILRSREVVAKYDHIVSYGIRRCEFDEYLLRRSGAELRLGRSLSSLEPAEDGWILNGEIRTRVLVGAGGHFCPVAQRLGVKLGQGEPIVAAQEAEFSLPPSVAAECHIEAELPEIFFTQDLKGYGWIFRKGDYVNIGLGRQDSHRLGEHVEDFLCFLRESGRISDAVVGKMHGHPYLLYGQAPRPLTGERALLIGDAAGLAYPRSGEGIRPAVESGLIAADTIIAAKGHYDAQSLAPYERRIVERFGARQPGRGILDLLPEWTLQGAARLLFGWQGFARRVVMDRWFFHADEPPLS